jgi:hypothetical protein
VKNRQYFCRHVTEQFGMLETFVPLSAMLLLLILLPLKLGAFAVVPQHALRHTSHVTRHTPT